MRTETKNYRPSVTLTEEGEGGNIFFLTASCHRVLLGVGLFEDAEEMSNRVFASESYEAAKAVLGEYCKITWV